MPGTTITPDPMPNVRAVRSGSMFSPEFGGMTANVEFEALTGFSNAFLPYGSIPYQQYVRGPVPSLASFFRAEGYETTAIHPFEGWFWNREHVYDSFGFDRFLSIEKLPPMASRGPLVSDDALTEEIIRRADATERPFFTFAVSLQGHGPYEPNRYRDAEVKVDSIASYRTRQSIQSYAEGIADADRSLKRLMDWAAQRDRHTVIVFFGDHLPPLNKGYTETGFLKEPVPERREPPQALAAHRETPLVVWSNRTGTLQGCRLDQPVADPAEAASGGRHRASLLHRLPRPGGRQVRRDRASPADLAERRQSDWSRETADRPADQRFPAAAVRCAVRPPADREALLSRPAEACRRVGRQIEACRSVRTAWQPSAWLCQRACHIAASTIETAAICRSCWGLNGGPEVSQDAFV